MAANANKQFLDVTNLNVRFRDGSRFLHAVRNVSFKLGRERLAIVGQSGSGKSTIMRALLGLLPPSAVAWADGSTFSGDSGQVDLIKSKASQLRELRGNQIAMVVQDPKQGLNPSQRVGKQIVEMIALRFPKARAEELRLRAIEALADVHINRPEAVIELLPHQVSGGMAQRVMIAMMLARSPSVLIADEATSALDVVVQHRVLSLIDSLVTEREMGLILISHDLNLVGRFADRILVMYQGKVLETLAGTNPLASAKHPYTKGLLACRPNPGNYGQYLPTLQRDTAWLI